jgi:hypothetical protein
MHGETCEATAIRRTQSSELLDLRMSCLARRRADLDVTLEALAQTDREKLRHAVQMIAGLPSLAPCADASGLLAIAPRPTDPVAIVELGACGSGSRGPTRPRRGARRRSGGVRRRQRQARGHAPLRQPPTTLGRARCDRWSEAARASFERGDRGEQGRPTSSVDRS